MRIGEVVLGTGFSAAGVVFIVNAGSAWPRSHLLFLAGIIMIGFGVVRILRANIPES